jgi:hypothetical protein
VARSATRRSAPPPELRRRVSPSAHPPYGLVHQEPAGLADERRAALIAATEG